MLAQHGFIVSALETYVLNVAACHPSDLSGGPNKIPRTMFARSITVCSTRCEYHV